MAEIVIPAVGIAMEEALLVKWHKRPGDAILTDEVVAEIETDKAVMELTSPVSGTLGPQLFEEGAIIPVGTVVVRVIAPGEEAEGGDGQFHDPARREGQAAPNPSSDAVGEDPDRLPHPASPRARRLAHGKKVPEQAERFRELIAAKVAESWKEIPHFSVTREIEAEAMLGTLDLLRARSSGPPPTLTDLFLRALALGLRECGHRGAIDLGLAVDTDHGVVIPVIDDVLTYDAEALVGARRAAVERARSGRLSAVDIETSPPSSLSNLGSYGVDQFTGIIAMGQSSLLTVGRVAARPAAADMHTARIRRSFFATLNADHRLVDGAGAARLLAAFASASEAMTLAF
jgi:pyruvate dehydrogenase E2 component (dihydrolipoamide acetyltransferase)